MWGKIFGGISGFFSAGPLGAAMGLMLGHAADKGTLLNAHSRKSQGLNPQHLALYATAKIAALAKKKDALYGFCCVVLSAKLAKCDGVVNRKEIDAFKRFIPVPKEHLSQVGHLFDMARHNYEDYQQFARLLGQTYATDKQPLEELLTVLYAIARSDTKQGESINEKETNFLKNIHKDFGLSELAWKRVMEGQRRARNSMNEEEAYATLNVDSDASNELLRKRWRALVRQYHPDVMMASHATAEEVERASMYISKVNAAWDVIKRSRDIS